MCTPPAHQYDSQLIADRRVLRYLCPRCGRCVEDRPEGLVLLTPGDAAALHLGGPQDESAMGVMPPTAERLFRH
jgi:ferredoxin